jgi:hypothetical protein
MRGSGEQNLLDLKEGMRWMTTTNITIITIFLTASLSTLTQHKEYGNMR